MLLSAGEKETTTMLADAQRDGRPAEYTGRWRPLLNLSLIHI